MAKQLNINLQMNADTSQAQKNLLDLKKALNEIAAIKIDNGNFNKDLQDAVKSAKELQVHINNAFNTKTGNLDISALDMSLKRTGQSLSSLTQGLLGAGMTGEKAFLKVASSISNANINLNKSQTLLSSFLTTLKNTARWQLSSSTIHAFMGSLQSAYYYAEDLNQSLNNIRIVTGQNIDQMATFAEAANKAARELNTTTTKYTDASLIYYQQGLSDELVKEYTDVTVKMANVSGDSATEVSSYMTAVWNNFNKAGDQSAEHFADVMTKLGATTAASTSEIAEGLEKFASIADTVGLSYDYATSALATVVANTRQSADVVGTAFKTIFARIDDLKLGKTLDDGLDLGKYSSGLEKVGVNVLDASGNLKQMDTILDDLASKWDTLSTAEQTALAETVAGTRQYTQLVALMNNWDDMEENLKTAANADGELNAQADIYAESWKAAKDSVQAALEGLYKDLNPEQLIIDMTNGFSSVVDVVDTLVDSFGGFQNIALLVSTILVNKFQPNIAQALDTGIIKTKELVAHFQNLGSNIKATGTNDVTALKTLFGKNKGAAANENMNAQEERLQANKTDVQKEYSKSLAKSIDGTTLVTDAFKTQVQYLQQIDGLQDKIKLNSANLTEEEQKKLSLQLEQAQHLSEVESALREQLELLEAQKETIAEQNLEAMYMNGSLDTEGTNGSASLTVSSDVDNLKSMESSLQNLSTLIVESGDAMGQITVELTEAKDGVRVICDTESDLIVARQRSLTAVSDTQDLLTKINLLQKNGNMTESQKIANMNKLVDQYQKEYKITETQAKSLKAGVTALKESSAGAAILQQKMAKASAEAKKMAESMGVTSQAIEAAAGQQQKLTLAEVEVNQATEQTKNAFEQITSSIAASAERALSLSGTLSKAIGNMTSMAMAASQIKNAISQWSNPDVGWIEKLLSTSMAAASAVQLVSNASKSLQSIMVALNTVEAGNVAIKQSEKVLSGELLATDAKVIAVKLAQKAAQEGLTESELAENLQKEIGMKKTVAEATARILSTNAIEGEATAEAYDKTMKEADTGATIALTLAEYGLLVPILLVVAALAALAIGFAVVTSAINAHAESLKRANDEAIKAAQQAKEEADANKELVNSYESTHEAYKQNLASKEEMQQAAEKLADAYDDEGLKVLALTGKYDQLSDAIDTARQKQLDAAQDKLKNAENSAENNFVAKMRDEDGRFSGDKYKANLGTMWGRIDDETVVKDAINSMDLKYVSESIDLDGKVNIEAGKSPEELVEAYEEVLAVVNHLKETTDDAEVLANSETYQAMTKWLNKSSEEYNKLKEVKQDLMDVDTESTIRAEIKSYNKEIGTISDYNKVVEQATQKLIEQGTEAEEAAEAVQSYMSTNSKYADLANQALVANDLAQKSSLSQKEAEDFVSGLNGNLSVLAQINFDEIKSKEQLQNTMERLQHEANAQEIQTKIGFVQDAKDNLKKDMSDADYAEYETTSGIDWGNKEDGIIEYSEFLKKTYAEQQQYLELIEKQYSEAYRKELQDAMAEQQAIIDELKEKQNEAFKDGHISDGAMYAQQINEAQQKMNELDVQFQVSQDNAVRTALESASTLAKVEAAWAQALSESGDQGANYQIYAERLKELAAEYDNCTNELEEYNKALISNDEAAKNAAEENLKNSIAIGEAAQKYGIDAKATEIQAKQLSKLSKELHLSEEEATRVAIANQRMNKGVKTLHDNWKNMGKVLKKTDHTTTDYADALSQAHEALADLVGATDAAAIPMDFLDSTTESGAEHLALMEKAANGDVQAINLLGLAVGEETVKNWEFNQSLFDAMEAAEAFGEGVKFDDASAQFDAWKNEILEGVTALQDAVRNGTIEAGDDVTSMMDGTGQSWVDSLNAMAIATGMGVDEMNSLLNQLGVQAKVDVVDVPQKMSVPTYTEVVEPNEVTVYNSEGQSETRHGWTHYTVPGPSKEVDGVAQVAQISTEDGSVSAPKITYTGTGGASSAGVSKSSTKGSGGKSKKGGSKPKKTKATQKDKIDETKPQQKFLDAIDDLSDALDLIGKQLDNISAAADRAIGPSRLKLMSQQQVLLKKQNENLKQQVTQYKNLQKAQQGIVKSRKNDLKKKEFDVYDSKNNKIKNTYADDIKIDKNGNVNYTKVMNQAYADYEKARKKWNSLTAEQQEKDKYKNEWADAEAKYEAIKELLEKYQNAQEDLEDTQKDIMDKENEIADNARQIADLALAKLDYELEIKVKIDDTELKQLKLEIEMLGSSAETAAERMSKLLASNGNIYDKATSAKDHTKDVLMDAEGGLGLSKADADAYINGDTKVAEMVAEKLAALDEDDPQSAQAILDGLQADMEATQDALQDLEDQMHDAFSTMQDFLEQSMEDFDNLTKVVDHANTMTQGYQDILNAVGKKNLDKDGSLTKFLNQSKIDQDANGYSIKKNKVATAQNEFDKIQKEYNAQKAAGFASETEAEEMKKLLQTAQDNLLTAQEEAQASLQTWIEDIGTAFEDTINKVIDDLGSAIAGAAGSLSILREEMEQAKAIDEQYIDDYQKIYELSKLNRQVQKDINATNNVKAKKQLMEYQQKIAEYQKDGVEMSEYELEVLQKEYDLELAKIQMEEAKEAKSQVRMTKDSEGNYSYVYTADETNIENAEQNYEDKLYALQELNTKYIKDLQDNIVSMEEEMASKIEEIMNDETLSIEEKQQRVDDVTEYYTERIKYYDSQLGIAIDNNKRLYENDWKAYSEKTGYKISADEKFIDQWNETTLAIKTGVKDQDTYFTNLVNSMMNARANCKTAIDNYKKDVDTALRASGKSWDTYSGDVKREVGKLEKSTDQASKDSDELKNTYETNFSDMMAKFKEFVADYKNKVASLKKLNKDLYNSYDKVLKKLKELMQKEKEHKNNKTPTDNTPSNNTPSTPSNNTPSGNTGNGGSSRNNKKNTLDSATIDGIAGAIWYWSPSAWGSGNERKTKVDEKFGAGAYDKVQAYINQHVSGNKLINGGFKYGYGDKDKYKAYYYSKFDTGGYTGDWGSSEGKFAMLHQKELVLNADDTQNMLSAINSVRDIAKMIDINALSAMMSTGLTAASFNGDNSSQLEQTVHITAEFPNATNKNEILEAFDNVINLASQYANRK